DRRRHGVAGRGEVHLHRVAVVVARDPDAVDLGAPGQRGLGPPGGGPGLVQRRSHPAFPRPHPVTSSALSWARTPASGLAKVRPLPLLPPWSPPAKSRAQASRPSDVKMREPLSPPWLKASVEAPSISIWWSKRKFPWS